MFGKTLYLFFPLTVTVTLATVPTHRKDGADTTKVTTTFTLGPKLEIQWTTQYLRQ